MKIKGLPVLVICLLAAAWLAFGGGLNIPWPNLTPTKATAATYFHEKDDTPVPSPVRSALNRLNRERNIIATEHEVDATDADSQIPDQYKVSLPAARSAGLPSFVVMGGETVLKVVKDPKAEEQLMEAVP